jgi:hypothetical protein
MKKPFCFVLFVCVLLKIEAQNTSAINCATAINQLQQYAVAINQQYNHTYFQMIPNWCPALNPWGMPHNPYEVQNCRNQMAMQLNSWYAMQCNQLNQWYNQIAYSCAQPNYPTESPFPGPGGGGGQQKPINTQAIEELEVGIDENKLVRIVIPGNPQGFRPRN